MLKYTKNMIYIKGENPLESIGTSFLKIHWLEPKLLQFKNWCQVNTNIKRESPYESIGISF